MLSIIPGAAIHGFKGDMTVTAIPWGWQYGGFSAKTGNIFESFPDNSYVAGVARSQYEISSSFIINVLSSAGAITCLTDPGPKVFFNQGVTKYFAIKRPNILLTIKNYNINKTKNQELHSSIGSIALHYN